MISLMKNKHKWEKNKDNDTFLSGLLKENKKERE